MEPPPVPNYDVFISHASEDRKDVALPVARLLKERGLKVWLDDFELTLGDSLRRSIDHGLSHSKFGVIILSPDFFRKEWSARELDGLLAREEDGEKVILPVWHRVSQADLLRFSPLLAGRLSISTSRGLEAVADAILHVVAGTAPHTSKASFDEEIAKELGAIRRKMLNARSHWDLQMYVYEVDEMMQRYPGHPEARMLRDQLVTAADFDRPAPDAAEGYSRSAAPLAPRSSVFLRLLIVISFLIALALLIFG
jgi:hypothetical protein